MLGQDQSRRRGRKKKYNPEDFVKQIENNPLVVEMIIQPSEDVTYTTHKADTDEVLRRIAIQSAVSKANQKIRETPVDPHTVPIPTKTDIFGHSGNLTAVITLLMNEESILSRVRSGQIPLQMYLITREWSVFASTRWPVETRAACLFYQEQMAKLKEQTPPQTTIAIDLTRVAQ